MAIVGIIGMVLLIILIKYVVKSSGKPIKGNIIKIKFDATNFNSGIFHAKQKKLTHCIFMLTMYKAKL